MNSEQFARYLEHTDHPAQLPLGPNVSSLYCLYQEHVRRFPYQNLDLYMNKPIRDLSTAALFDSVSSQGGYCFHHSELMMAALQHLGFQVERIATWALMGDQFQEGMPLNHDFLWVKIEDEMFICDPGLAGATPRFPLKFNFTTTEEITPSEGNKYKLEVHNNYYQLHWWMKDSWLLLYRFERDVSMPKTSDQETTHKLCKLVHEYPGFSPIRDKHVKVSLHTNDSDLDFMFIDGEYTFRKFQRGKRIVSKTLDSKQFFMMIKEMCNLEFDLTEIPKK